jgi:hypothetical protein
VQTWWYETPCIGITCIETLEESLLILIALLKRVPGLLGDPRGAGVVVGVPRADGDRSPPARPALGRGGEDGHARGGHQPGSVVPHALPRWVRWCSVEPRMPYLG